MRDNDPAALSPMGIAPSNSLEGVSARLDEAPTDAQRVENALRNVELIRLAQLVAECEAAIAKLSAERGLTGVRQTSDAVGES